MITNVLPPFHESQCSCALRAMSAIHDCLVC